MKTEINKNIKWNSKIDVLNRKNKVLSSTIKLNLNTLMSTFINAIKSKHM